MNSNEIQNDKIKSTLIKIEALKKEYEVVLQQYQESGKNYIQSLQSATNEPTNSATFVALQGRTWWGTGKLSEGPASTQQECENMCASSSQCSGATFNPVKRYCWTRTGDGELSTGRDDDYALITQQKSVLTTMKYLNERLLELNKQITNEMQTIEPTISEQYKLQEETQYQLNNSYEQLLEQKIELDKQMQEYYSVEQDEINQSKYVTRQNIMYKLWSIIACVIILFLVKKLFEPNVPTFVIGGLVLLIGIMVLSLVA